MGSYVVSRVGVGADHLGRALKDDLAAHLRGNGIEVADLGVGSDEPVDYPDIAARLATDLVAGDFDRGILVCGTGAGMAITANKVPGVRAVCVTDPYTAERAIASNDAQVITFGAQVTGANVARMLADIYLSTTFDRGRSGHKVAKIDALEDGAAR